ncbi:hypothetical protein EWM64_g12 [Hericium alpestre]|uniref:Uncharacterized protein n=1 Tax=Hericium alpestre TaxID=135208 RepID=A0A4Z0ACS6_9AGAM|nr:hypothetical protein EWM64_g12 [Hericium alpestre]
MPYYESPDATVALRAAWMSRHLQAGDSQVYPSLPASSPFTTPTPKERRRQQPPTRDPHFKSLGKGAFMKDMVFQRKGDGTVVATPKKNADLEQMGRTIYAPKAQMQSTQHRSARNAARRRRQLPTKPNECATLRRLASIDAKELGAQVKKTPKWVAFLQDNLEELTWGGYKVRACGAEGLWSPLLSSDDRCTSPASRTPSTPGLTTASSSDSESEPPSNFRATDLEAALEQEVIRTKVDRMFDMFIDGAACAI